MKKPAQQRSVANAHALANICMHRVGDDEKLREAKRREEKRTNRADVILEAGEKDGDKLRSFCARSEGRPTRRIPTRCFKDSLLDSKARKPVILASRIG